MRTAWRVNCRALGAYRGLGRRWLSDERRFAPSDYVILQPTRSTRDSSPLFLGPLTPGKVYDTHRGRISHDSIIGRAVRDVLETNGKNTTRLRLHEVRLEDYVVLCRRLVTPIYPYDANLIVSLLDLHPDHNDGTTESTTPQIEILEAGTGNGALTLYLSRAIHAANRLRPKQTDDVSEEAHDDAVREWKKSRQAIIHTIEVSAKHSKHASKVVRGFRQGQYHSNVDFHVGNVSTWVEKALEDRSGRPFLTHAFLDLPGVQDHVSTAANALKTDGTLIIFCPSITQINECALNIRKGKIPLDLDRVIELGVNGGTGGRLWDVRLVKPRAWPRQTANAADDTSIDSVQTQEDDAAALGDAEASTESVQPATQPDGGAPSSPGRETQSEERTQGDGWQLVCRPKVGDRVTGGGFLAVFKRKSADDTRDSLEAELSNSKIARSS